MDTVFERLLRLGAGYQDTLQDDRGSFHDLIHADHVGAIACLRDLRSTADSFLELGSGVGVITIIADLLGYDAYGIEIEPRLVAEAERLATRFDSGATFVESSFVPIEDQEDVHLLSSDHFTVSRGQNAYEELGMDIADFDLVYGYPWPEEEEWMIDLVRRHAGPTTTFLRYSGRDGFLLTDFASGAEEVCLRDPAA